MILQLQIICITSASGNIYLSRILSEYPVLLEFPSSGSKDSVGTKYTQYSSFQENLKEKITLSWRGCCCSIFVNKSVNKNQEPGW